MNHHQRMDVARGIVSELQQCQVTAALCVDRLHELMATDEPLTSPNFKIPHMDENRYCVVWKHRRCHLGYTTSFRLLSRLLRRADQFVSYDHLLRDVWDGRVISPPTVRSAVRHLKTQLIKGKMRRLADSIHCHGQSYGLILSRH